MSSIDVVRLTPPGRGALASLAVEGPGALRAVDALFRPAAGPPLAERRAGQLVFGRFGRGAAEEVVVRVRSAESVEIHCHGGDMAVSRIEGLLVDRGCRTLGWREWIGRRSADPTCAEARRALAEARTERAAAILLDQLAGALRRALAAIRKTLAEGNGAEAQRRIGELLGRAELGRRLVEPWRVVLAGAPNVGKSSLMNALAGYPRAIVHPTAGTTRDVVTLNTSLDGWPVELSDTAGLRETDHPLERAGVEAARRQLSQADLVVLVFDAGQPWSAADQRLLESRPQALVVHNKVDLPAPPGPPRPPGLSTIGTTGQGIAALGAEIARRLVPEVPPPGSAVPFIPAHVEILRRSIDCLRRGDVAAADRILGSLT